MKTDDYRKDYAKSLFRIYSKYRIFLSATLLNLLSFILIYNIPEFIKDSEVCIFLISFMIGISVIYGLYRYISDHRCSNPSINTTDFILYVLLISSFEYFLYTIFLEVFSVAYTASAVVCFLFLIVIIQIRSTKFEEINSLPDEKYKYSSLKDLFNGNISGERIVLSDKPCLLDNDLFNFEFYARHLTGAINELSGNSGFVIGIEGVWGSGKTSVISMAKEILNREDSSENIEWIDFNLWLYDSEEAIIRGLWDELAKASGNRADDQYIHELINDICKSNAILASLRDLVFDGRKESLAYYHEGLQKTFGQLKKTIIVVIDDFDRAASTNSRFLLKMLNLVFNLPHVIFLVTYDRNHIAEIYGNPNRLEKADEADFSDKIINKEISIPSISEEHKKSVYKKCLINMMKHYGMDIEKSEKDRFEELSMLLLAEIKDIRTLIRLINSLDVLYDYQGLLLNFVDLFGIKVLEFFNPNLTHQIAADQECFTVNSKYVSISDSEKKKWKLQKERFDKNFQAESNQKWYEFCDKLFLKFNEVIDNQEGLENSPCSMLFDILKNNRRICIDIFFPTYFHYDKNAHLETIRNIEILNNRVTDLKLSSLDSVQVIGKILKDEFSFINLLPIHNERLSKKTRLYLVYYFMETFYTFKDYKSLELEISQSEVYVILTSCIYAMEREEKQSIFERYYNISNLWFINQLYCRIFVLLFPRLSNSIHNPLQNYIFSEDINIYSDEIYRPLNSLVLILGEENETEFVTYIKQNSKEINFYRVIYDFIDECFEFIYNIPFKFIGILKEFDDEIQEFFKKNPPANTAEENIKRIYEFSCTQSEASLSRGEGVQFEEPFELEFPSHFTIRNDLIKDKEFIEKYVPDLPDNQMISD